MSIDKMVEFLIECCEKCLIPDWNRCVKNCLKEKREWLLKDTEK